MDRLRRVLAGHKPYPAAVVDRWRELQQADSGVAVPTEGVRAGPAGAASQHAAAEPAPRRHGTAVANPGQWRAHLLTRLRHRRARAPADGRLAELHQELAGYPGGTDESVPANGVVLALRYRRGEQELALFSISAAVDTATDVTVEELAIETFYPPIRPRPGHSSQGCLPRWRDGRPFGVRHCRTGPRCEDWNDWPRSGPVCP